VRLKIFAILGAAVAAAPFGNVNLIWPQRDGLIWPHLMGRTEGTRCSSA